MPQLPEPLTGSTPSVQQLPSAEYERMSANVSEVQHLSTVDVNWMISP